MVERDTEVRNAARREYVAQQGKKSKAKAKLTRRMALKKAEKEDNSGELKRVRLATNVPRTIENTREWVGGPEVAEDDAGQVDEEGDARSRPVKIVAGGAGNETDVVVDMAGLENLFSPDGQAEASTSQLPPPPHKPILLTTCPRPHGPTYAFLKEFQSLLGGEKHAHAVPRKNARFELSKVCKWATKRGYGAILVFGEDLHGNPATLTMSLLPHGPCAHFRLTSVQLHRTISNSANPTSHVPELVLSNFSTPLGLSTGRLLQSMFPPLPQIVGRQVVAIHNQRDFIFFRRFRYMFALRETEQSRKAAKSQGRDEELRTKIQEIGPRFTLKLRWLKRGALGTGRRLGGNRLTAESLTDNNKKDEAEETQEKDGDDVTDKTEQDLSQADKESEAVARQEMMDRPGEAEFTDLLSKSIQPPSESQTTVTNGNQPIASANLDAKSTSTDVKQAASKKRKRVRTHSPGGTIHIPEFTMPEQTSKSELPQQRKLRKGASILDSLAVTVRYGRGGTKKDDKEWEWNPRMQISRRKFVL